VKSKEPSLFSFWQNEGSQGQNFARVAVVGIGNELNGDDAAGILTARKLKVFMQEQERSGCMCSPALLVIEAGLAPEAFTGPLRRFQPDLVALIDAAELGEAPGVVRWLDWTVVESMSASTHILSPSIFAQYLVSELGCRVVLAGIQPKQLGFEQGVSKEVQKAVTRVVDQVVSEIQARNHS
jgi:hydrogenase 3 maturation protease